MPSVSYKGKGGKMKNVKTAYTRAGKAKAKALAKKLGGKVVSRKPTKKG
tara:strand:- start:2291 stop:2437 length:147 start_codon:yes stop_codon:yes gene_type:complete